MEGIKCNCQQLFERVLSKVDINLVIVTSNQILLMQKRLSFSKML